MIYNAVTLLVLAAAALLPSSPRPPPPPPNSPRPPTPPPRPPNPPPPTPPAAAAATWPVQLGMLDRARGHDQDIAERIFMEYETVVTTTLPLVSFPTDAESVIMPDFIWELCKPLEIPSVALTSPECTLLFPSADELATGTLYSHPGAHKSAIKLAEYLNLEETAAQLNSFATGVQLTHTVELSCCALEGEAHYTDPTRTAVLPAAGEHQCWQKEAAASTQELPEPAMGENAALLNSFVTGVQLAHTVELRCCAPEGAARYTDPTRTAIQPAAGEHQRWKKGAAAPTQLELPEPAMGENAAQLNSFATGVHLAHTVELSCCAPEGTAHYTDPTRTAILPAAGEHQRWQKEAAASTQPELSTLALEGKALFWVLCVIACFLSVSSRCTGHNMGSQPTADTLLLQDTKAGYLTVVTRPAVPACSVELWGPIKQDCQQ